ncbi:MAG: VOC family protein [Ignavibacteria bacterium]|nr:VOC family protein [Ignavibacteria bacterium]
MSKIPDSTKIQSIDLRVRDMKTSIDFYCRQMGFREIERNDNTVLLSSNGSFPYLFKLVEDKKAPVRIKGTTGLYHIAILFPNRKELARVFLRLFNDGVKFRGFSDHLVSEAIYLDDPDGNGIELYVDKPKETWVWKNGEVVMDSLPLDLSLITNELTDKDDRIGIHPDTFLGHIHLNVSDLRKAEEFYNEIIKMKISNYSYPGAKFFAAGDYHHHIGTNTWQTNKKIKRNENSLGMISFTIKIPDADFLKQLAEKSKESGYEIIKQEDKSISVKDMDGNVVNINSD